MNIRNVLDTLKLYVGESKDSEHQIFVAHSLFSVGSFEVRSWLRQRV